MSLGFVLIPLFCSVIAIALTVAFTLEFAGSEHFSQSALNRADTEVWAKLTDVMLGTVLHLLIKCG